MLIRTTQILGPLILIIGFIFLFVQIGILDTSLIGYIPSIVIIYFGFYFTIGLILDFFKKKGNKR